MSYAKCLISLLEKKDNNKKKDKDDPINPSKKTRSEARKCLDKIEKCLDKDPRIEQSVGTVPPNDPGQPPPRIVPDDKENKNGKSDSSS